MDMNDETLDLQDLLNDHRDAAEQPLTHPAETHAPVPEPASLSPFLHRIPVTLTLEAGAARITLQELAALTPDSVVALDTLVGDPLTIKVNGTAIGKGEVVVSGDSYGLKVLELHAKLPTLTA